MQFWLLRSVDEDDPHMRIDDGISIVQIPFGYTRKDVIAIGVGLLGFGIALKYGLEVHFSFRGSCLAYSRVD